MTWPLSRTAAALLFILVMTGCVTTPAPDPGPGNGLTPVEAPGGPEIPDELPDTSEEDQVWMQNRAFMSDIRTALDSDSEIHTEQAEQLIQRIPDSSYARLLAGAVYSRNGQVESARRQFTRSAELDPGNDHAYSALGRMAEEAGDLAEADLYYTKAHEAASTPATANRLALLRIQGGYVESAREILQRSLESYPDDQMTRNNLAVAHDLLGATSEGIGVLAGETTTDARLLRTRALLQLKEGRPDEAILDLDRGAGNTGDSQWLLLGIADLQRGELEKAQEKFRTAIETAPGEFEGYLNLGLTLRRQGKFSEAAGVYQDGLDKSPHPDLHLNLGVLYELYRGEPALALEQYRKYLEQQGPAADRVRGWVEYLEGVVENN